MRWRFSRFMKRFWASTRLVNLFVVETPDGKWRLEVTTRLLPDTGR